MTDETPKPHRKRRRRIIVGVLISVVGLAAWWNWPRGDPRLVGTWRWVNQSRAAGSPLTLKRNGSGGRPGVWIPWRTSGDKLTLGVNWPLWLENKARPWEPWISANFGLMIVHPERRWTFKVLTADRIRLTLDVPDRFEEVELQRLRE